MIWGLMVPPLSQKWLIFASLGQDLSQKVDIFLIFSQFYQLAFLTKCWLFQTRNPPLSLFLAYFFGCCIFIVLFKSYLKGRLLTKKAP